MRETFNRLVDRGPKNENLGLIDQAIDSYEAAIDLELFPSRWKHLFDKKMR